MKNALEIFKEIEKHRKWKENSLQKILKKYPKEGKGLYRHDELVFEYQRLMEEGLLEKSKTIEERIKMKPIRTQSGVATITVLMKPYPCPGNCIFCGKSRA